MVDGVSVRMQIWSVNKINWSFIIHVGTLFWNLKVPTSCCCVQSFPIFSFFFIWLVLWFTQDLQKSINDNYYMCWVRNLILGDASTDMTPTHDQYIVHNRSSAIWLHILKVFFCYLRDTAGQESFRTLTSMHFRGTKVRLFFLINNICRKFRSGAQNNPGVGEQSNPCRLKLKARP